MFAGAISNSSAALEREIATGKQIDVLTHMYGPFRVLSLSFRAQG